MEKICNKCKEKKPLSEFYLHSRSNKYHMSVCKSCYRERARQWKLKNPERVRNNAKKWRRTSKKYLDYNRTWSKNNPEKTKESIRKSAAKDYAKNQEKHRQRARNYYHEHQEERKKAYKDWVDTHRSMRREYNSTFRKKARLHRRISEGIRQSLHGNKHGRSWESLVGYTTVQLKKHLEKQFTDGMDWGAFQRGEIHIDHITPRCIFQFTSPDDVQFKACWALENLRPMWAKENISKGAKLLQPFQQYLL